ncbi:hypothetical protein [Vibrio cincinnatiensis]|uniref:hypothetical protein n=1 Tax=Vibrio cincinnatiensis TaxID=675 RepID=UPI001EDE7995|nr:hypothetical protein [Vibrio cincinnatiensis]MCG3728996.1 hypothetical protein [Vibrio cincinnatiensis]
MSLPPITYYYECRACGTQQTLEVIAFAVAPRLIKCKACKGFTSEIEFKSKIKKESYQKRALRRAGESLIAASELAPECDSGFAKNLRRAGEVLKEFP